MTAAEHDRSSSDARRVVFGAYVREGIEHTLVALRDDEAPWTLIEIARDTTNVIETFYRDEELDSVQAVAKLYLADRRTQPPMRRVRPDVTARGLGSRRVHEAVRNGLFSLRSGGDEDCSCDCRVRAALQRVPVEPVLTGSRMSEPTRPARPSRSRHERHVGIDVASQQPGSAEARCRRTPPGLSSSRHDGAAPGPMN